MTYLSPSHFFQSLQWERSDFISLIYIHSSTCPNAFDSQLLILVPGPHSQQLLDSNFTAAATSATSVKLFIALSTHILHVISPNIEREGVKKRVNFLLIASLSIAPKCRFRSRETTDRLKEEGKYLPDIPPDLIQVMDKRYLNYQTEEGQILLLIFNSLLGFADE